MKNIKCPAITTHPAETYGDILSPILLSFQKNVFQPIREPASSYESNTVGLRVRTYVHVQMRRRMTIISSSKLKTADIV